MLLNGRVVHPWVSGQKAFLATMNQWGWGGTLQISMKQREGDSQQIEPGSGAFVSHQSSTRLHIHGIALHWGLPVDASIVIHGANPD